MCVLLVNNYCVLWKIGYIVMNVERVLIIIERFELTGINVYRPGLNNLSYN